MQEISEKKKRFLESIGIDINNLPPEFNKHSDSMEDTLSREEINFLDRESLTGRYNKTFCLKDLIGTTHPNYANKTWLEAFLLSKRGDDAVEKYFRNPDYYSTGLKQQDQSDLRHDSPIELCESDGKFFIKGGNNRLSLIMMKYLAEMSKAKTAEEKAKIDEEYTFVAEVQPTPKDKDIMYMINMIKEVYGNGIKIQRIADNDSDCKYTIQLEGETITISSKEDLEQVLRVSYKVDRVESLDELRGNIENLIQDRIVYGVRTDKNRERILNSVFPNLQQFQESFIKLKEYGISDKLFEETDLHSLSFTELSNKAIQMAEREEKTRIEECQRKEKQQAEEKRKIAEENEETERKSEQRKKNINVGLKKEYIGQYISSIPESVETIYYELKQEEIKFSDLARKLGLSYSITRTDDTNMLSGIEQIKRNMQKINEQIQGVDDPKKLDKVSGVLQELNTLAQDGTIKTEHSAELKEAFEKSFDAKVQELIKSSKISRLEEERGRVESEKVSIIGNLFGKGKLKRAKLDNIDLKMQLLMSENRE